jgi:N-acetylneuraminate lyase
MTQKLLGLIAATHTPFHADGSLNLDAVEKQAEHLLRVGVKGVFVAGSTGESSSLTVEERMSLTRRWCEVARNTHQQVVIHVGSNCLADARTIAAHAQKEGVAAIAALSPSYFKPATVEALVGCCAEVASAAPGTPFYFYDIPVLTNVNLPAPRFLELAPAKIPMLAGLKFTNPDLMNFQKCLHADGGRFDVLFGMDEILLAAVALGARGAVGSTYNFGAPIYHRVLSAFEKGDLATARAEQFRAVQMIEKIVAFGFIGATKAVMSMLGVDVGPGRLPNVSLTREQHNQLLESLSKLGFFEWVKV